MTSALRAVLVAAALAPAAAQAVETRLESSFSARLEHNDNPRFLVQGATPATTAVVSPALLLRRRSERSESSLDARLNINESTLAILSTVDYSLAGRLAWSGERSNLGLNAGLRRDATLSSEFQGGGIAFVRAPRSTHSFGGSAGYAIDERDRVSVEATLSRTAFDERRPGLADFASEGFVLAWSRVIDPRWTVQASWNRSRFETDPLSVRSATDGVQAGLTWTASARERLSLSVNPSRVQSEVAAFALFCPVAPEFCQFGLVPFRVVPAAERRTSDGVLYSAGYDLQWSERASLALRAVRGLNPSSVGQVIRSESLSGEWTYRFHDRLALSADAGLSELQPVSIAGAPGTQTRRAGALLVWRLDERLRLEAGVRWQEAQFGDGRKARSTSLQVTLAHEFRPRRM